MVRAELRDLLAELGLPTLLVTHDFRDAAALADRDRRDGRRRAAPARPAGRARWRTRPTRSSPALTGANVLPGLAGENEAIVAHPWELTLAAERPDGARAVPGILHGVVPEGDRVRVRVGDVVVLADEGELERLGLERGAPAWAVLPPGPPRIVAG